MITLEDIQNKVDSILNGTDVEISVEQEYIGSYRFLVATEGFSFKNAYDMRSGKNIVPVFLSSMGGQYNAVAELKEVDLNTTITLFFPVRKKYDFYKLNEYLVECFVGKILTYGTQKARSNISVAQYGELQNIDTKQFKEWAENTYKMPISVMETWMSMTFTLYLTTVEGLGVEGGYLFGENFAVSSVKYDSTTIDDITFIQHTSSLVSQVNSEQLLGETLAKSIVSGTSQVFEFPFYIKNKSSYKTLVADYMNGTINNKEIEIEYDFCGDTYIKVCIIQNASIHSAKGELLGISLTLSPKVE